MIPWQIYADYLEDKTDARLFRLAEPKMELDEEYEHVRPFGSGTVYGHIDGDGAGGGYWQGWGQGFECGGWTNGDGACGTGQGPTTPMR